MENRSYPDFIWWARTQEVYPDGVIGVLNSALAVPNICACRNSVVIGDRILSLKGTTWWRIRDPLLLETTVFALLLLQKQNDGGTYGLIAVASGRAETVDRFAPLLLFRCCFCCQSMLVSIPRVTVVVSLPLDAVKIAR